VGFLLPLTIEKRNPNPDQPTPSTSRHQTRAGRGATYKAGGRSPVTAARRAGPASSTTPSPSSGILPPCQGPWICMCGRRLGDGLAPTRRRPFPSANIAPSRTAELTWSDWLAISSDPGGRLRPEIPTSSCRPHRLGYEAFLDVKWIWMAFIGRDQDLQVVVSLSINGCQMLSSYRCVCLELRIILTDF
ncbi:unnamed protein product, partial [Urochloa humidicola]